MFISYSQNFEDVILNRLFKDKESGFYIDVGAHHPVYDSVTKAFYDQGWRGINIEPAREFFDLLQQSRPDDINLQLAAGDKESALTFFELQGSGFSTLDRDSAMKLAAERNLHLSCYEVPVLPLAEICRKYDQTTIDFLKIDVEGWEEQVIAGNDWESYRPIVILVEATVPNSPIRRDTNILSFLQNKGYDYVYFDGLNDYYLAREASDLGIHFQTPPNVFDNFIRFDSIDLKNQIISLNQYIEIKEQDLNQYIENNEQDIFILTQSLEDERFEIKRLLQEIEKLKILKDEQFNNYQNQVSELQVLVSKSSHQTSTLQEQFLDLQKELSQAKERILAIKSSKFWKLRYLWFRLRKSLGIPGD
jgi:FkbM family methyltransferase